MKRLLTLAALATLVSFVGCSGATTTTVPEADTAKSEEFNKKYQEDMKKVMTDAAKKQQESKKK